ncbi:hypothetical protein ACIQU5_06180 [Streptomyces sp. NPDC090306]|uniref:hypothetical protein n=1 Tax=unclassified Streptomyces TaxID=2593676 RepID=UPI0036EDE9D7
MTEKLFSPLRDRPWPERWLVRALGAGLAATAYRALVPSVPVSRPGAIALAAVLLSLAVYLGRRDGLAWPLLLVAVPPAVLLHGDLRTERYAYAERADLAQWPLPWASATLVIGAGVLAAAVVGRRFRPSEDADPLVYRRCAARTPGTPAAD